MLLIHLLAILVQWASGAWCLPPLRPASSPTPLDWVLSVLLVAAFVASKRWMFSIFARHRASPMFKEHAKNLITDFPFSVARNPFYALDFLPFLVLTLLLGMADPLLLHAPLFFLFLAVCVVPAEERRLRRAHGATYQTYAARVRRWGLF